MLEKHKSNNKNNYYNLLKHYAYKNPSRRSLNAISNKSIINKYINKIHKHCTYIKNLSYHYTYIRYRVGSLYYILTLLYTICTKGNKNNLYLQKNRGK